MIQIILMAVLNGTLFLDLHWQDNYLQIRIQHEILLSINKVFDILASLKYSLLASVFN